ncbi:hypothetical protein GCM10022243_07300 [Saccharothrix violaceirubra]|uniref:ATP-dependent DNA helicase RecG n=1 Tax=Saccharothrix violaceirubra TaxID=413306 RepID=A0A7W7SY88_9PSEU|nr:ATP-binding protein [Saccharothrix violaceirubra]MBB4963142.1 ATP-dependent DNA helicase RecG [Saccharothrix violaceirubra]
MTDEELAEIVGNLRALGSDVAEVEAKRAQTGLPRSVRETLSSFANTAGGVLILGLDESRGFFASGVADAAKTTADLGAMCSTEMEPPVRPLIRAHLFEGVTLVVAEIPEADPSLKPCYYKGAGATKGSYVRVGDGDRQLSAYEVQMLISSRGQPREDEQAVVGSSIDSLDPDAVRALAARLRQTRPYAFGDQSDEQVLRDIRALVVDASGAERASLAGLLTLGRYPQGSFPQLMLTFVHYPTEGGADDATGERFVDNVMVEGPIPVMVRETMAVIRRNMSRRAVVTGHGRSDVWEYPETALREAVVNALAHRDLSAPSLGTQVQVEMYPDRISIRNPGGLFGPVTLDTLGAEGISSSRNATLLKILEDVTVPGESRTVCENRGSGIRSMMAALRAAGMSAPRFVDRISSFTVEFPSHCLLGADAVEWIAGLGEQGLTDSQCMALALLRSGQVLDNGAYRAATGLDSRVATVELQDLVTRGLVEQTGTRRWARYRSAATPADRTSVDRPSAWGDRRGRILDALGGKTLSRAELSSATGLSDQTVLHWLRILRGEGVVEIVGPPRSRNARYRRTGRRV